MKSYLIKILAGFKNGFLTLMSVFAGFIAPIQGLIFLSVMLCLMDFLVKIYLVGKKKGLKQSNLKKWGKPDLRCKK